MSKKRTKQQSHDGAHAPEIQKLAVEIASLIQQTRTRMAAIGMLEECERVLAESDVEEPESTVKSRTAKGRKAAGKKQPKKGRRK